MIDPAIFKSVALFTGLEDSELQALSRVASSRHYAAGAPILRAAEPGDLFFVIVRGEVKVFVDSPEGREVVLTHLQAGEFFGEMALFEDETRSASVTAVTEAELVVLTRNDFLTVLGHDFPLTRKILKTLSSRLRRANDVIESLALQDVGGRLARYLLRLVDASDKPPVDGYYEVNRPTHQEIANSIGATRETVTRMLKQFEDRKLIRVQGHRVFIPVEVPPGARGRGVEKAVRGPWTLPNFITLIRLAALPFFLVSIANGRFDIALAIFVAAGISDGVDGYLARRFDMKSALGAYLDPIADKLLLISSFLFLAIPSYPARAKVPVWLAVMVLSRDFLMLLVALLLILSSGRKRFPPTWAGKVTTVTQIITVLFVLCANIWDWPRAVLLIAFGASATATTVSGFDYVYRVARNPEEPLSEAA